MYIRSFQLMLVAMMLFSACASSERIQQVPDSIRHNLSAHPGDVVIGTTNEVFRLWGYDVRRREADSNNLYYETEWKRITALDDERASGHDVVEVQILVTGRQRASVGSTAGTWYSTVFQAFVRAEDGDPMTMSDERREYLNRIIQEMDEKLITRRIHG